jgi:non-lysosomal glucosylceramidase
MPYSKQELLETGTQKTYSNEATEAAFLLGGIGAGNISIGSRGELRDWEIFNYPGKGINLPNSYFSIWAKEEGKAPVAKVLETKLNPPHNISHGYHPSTAAGLPHMTRSTLRGEYPIAWVDFEDEDLPVKVELEAYTPLIPLNPEDSGLPGAIFTYRVTNTAQHPVEVSIVGSIINPVGNLRKNRFNRWDYSQMGQNDNEFRESDNFQGIYLHSKKYSSDHLSYGNMSLVTTNKNITYKRAWLRGAWFDYLQEFWDDFKENGRLTDLQYRDSSTEGSTDTASLGVFETLAPGESKEIRFVLTWYFPNRLGAWEDHLVVIQKEPAAIVQNHYVNQFESSWAVAEYMVKEFERLDQYTRLFHGALFSSTLPSYVVDALASNIPVLRSTTCFWLKDGRFLGYEGCFDEIGCCLGNCTHVWNYAQTLAFLFPSLEMNMRRTEFLEEVEDDGKMNFRALKLFKQDWFFHTQSGPAAADGQMGTIMRVYREWKLTGDDQFLKELWPSVKKTLKFATIQWDTDGDYVFDSAQHNTYDIDFYGPNPLSGIFFLGALKASSAIAAYLGESETVKLYEEVFEKSSKRLDELLWNGEFYIQKLEDVNAYKYQHGLGCLSDQLLGQQLAHVYGLGYLLPQEKVEKAVSSIYKYNYKEDFSNHENCQRVYVLNDENGLRLCSWPNGGRPHLPFVYSDEVWTGIEYQVASHLLYEGLIEEGLTIVKAVRDRHDGFRRNPWNEVECGHHYARSMASWALLPALSGFTFDMVQKEIRFAPIINQDDFVSFWSTGLGWGTYEQRKNMQTGEIEADVKVLYGDLTGVNVIAGGKEWTL